MSDHTGRLSVSHKKEERYAKRTDILLKKSKVAKRGYLPYPEHEVYEAQVVIQELKPAEHDQIPRKLYSQESNQSVASTSQMRPSPEEGFISALGQPTTGVVTTGQFASGYETETTIFGLSRDDLGYIGEFDPVQSSIGLAVWVGMIAAGQIAMAMSGSDSSSAMPAASVTNVTSNTVTAMLGQGPFIGGVLVKVYKVDGSLLTSGVIDSNGKVVLDVGSYNGAVLLVATDDNGTASNYMDEATLTAKDLGNTILRAATVVNVGNTLVYMTVLTELAVRKMGLTSPQSTSLSAVPASSITETNTAIAQLFLNKSADISSVAPNMVVSPTGADNSANANEYGRLLAILSGYDATTASGATAPRGTLTTLNTLETLTSVTNGVANTTDMAQLVDMVNQGLQQFNTSKLQAISQTDPLVTRLLKLSAPQLALGAGVSDGATSSEAVQSTGVVTVNAVSGALLNITLSNGNKTVTKSVTGTGSAAPVVLAASDLDTLGNGTITVRAVAGNTTLQGAATETSFVLDTVAPTVVISSNKQTLLGSTDTTVVTFTFSEPPSKFTQSSVTVSGGQITSPQVLASDAKVYTATLTPDSGSSTSTVSIVAGSYTDAAGNPGGAGAALSWGVIAPPVVTMALGTGVADGATSSEAVQASGVVTVSGNNGGTLTASFVRGSTTLTRTLTANGSAQPLTLDAADLTQLGDGVVSVSATVKDSYGNVSPVTSTTFVLDTVSPVIPTLSLINASLINRVSALSSNGIFTVTSENTSNTNVTLERNGAIVVKSLTGTGSAQPVVLTDADLAVLGNGTVTVSVSSKDAAGNVSNASSGNFVLNAAVPAKPALSLASGYDNWISMDKAGTSLAVVTTGMQAGDRLQLKLSGSDFGTAYTLTQADVTAGKVTLAVAKNTLGSDGIKAFSVVTVDVAGNISPPSDTLDVTLDTQPPTITTTTTVVMSSGSVMIQSSEPVTAYLLSSGFTANSVANITASPSSQWKSAIISTANSPTALNVTGLSEGVYKMYAVDNAGNFASASQTVTIDGKVPTLLITSSKALIPPNDNAVITFAFSENVTGFDLTDVQLNSGSGTLSNFQGSGAQYTATFTMAATPTQIPTITVAKGSYTDLAGNPGEAGVTPVLSYDSTLPRVSITSNVSAVKAGGTALVTFWFSGTTTNFDSSDITVVGGTVTGFTGSADFYTATFVPSANSNLTASISVAANSYTVADRPGIAGLANITVQTQIPNAPSLTLGTGVADGATFAEATQSGGVLLGFATNGTIMTTYTRTGVTPLVKQVTASGASQPLVLTASEVAALGDGLISVSSRVVDAIGNSSAAVETSFNLDTQPPVAPILALGSGVSVGATLGKATQTSGVISVVAESGSTWVVSFKNGTTTINKTLVGTGDVQSVVLTSADVGGSSGLADGNISVSAVTTDAAGNVSQTATTSFMLDTQAPGQPTLQIKAGQSATLNNATRSVDVEIAGTGLMAGGKVQLKLADADFGRAYTVTSADVTAGKVSLNIVKAELGADGVKALSAVLSDMAGNVSVASSVLNLTVTTVTPDKPILAIPAGQNTYFGLNKTSMNLEVTGSNIFVGNQIQLQLAGTNLGAAYTVTANDVAAGKITMSVARSILGSDGIKSVTARVIDTAQNMSAASDPVKLVVDTVAPAQPVLALKAGQSGYVNAASSGMNIDLTNSGLSDGDRIQMKLGGVNIGTVYVVTTPDVAAGKVTINVPKSALGADGNKAITAVITDLAGNVGVESAALNLVLDTVAPNAASLALGNNVNASGVNGNRAVQSSGVVTVSGESGATAWVTFFRSGGGTVTKSVSVTGTGQPQGVVLQSSDVSTLGDGTVLVSTTLVDAAGNTSMSVSTSFWMETNAPNAPVVALGSGVSSGASSSKATQTTGVVTVMADVGSTINVTFTRAGGGRVDKTLTANGSVQAVVLNTSDLATLGEGSIAVSATATSQSGNVSGSSSTGFVLDVTPPSSPLITLGTGVSDGVTASKAVQVSGVVLVTADNNSAVAVTFSRGSNKVVKTLTANGSAQAVSLDSASVLLLGDGTITVTATATDGAGNVSNPQTQSFVLDTQAPSSPSLTLGNGVADGVTSSEAVQTSGVVLVNAEAAAKVQVTFSSGSKTVVKTITATGSAQPVTLTASDLGGTAGLPDGEVTVQATATDVAGNVGSTAVTRFTLDTVAPVAPTLALGSGVSNGANSATATQASGVVTVNAEENSTVLLTFTRSGGTAVNKTVTSTGTMQGVTLTAADLTALGGDGSITVSATARDMAGNLNSAAVGSTTFVLDTQAPTASIVSATAGNVQVSSSEIGTAYLVNSNVVVNSVSSITSAPGTHWKSVTISAANTNTTFPVSGLLDGSYKLYSRDLAGNLSQPTQKLVTIDNTSPTVTIASNKSLVVPNSSAVITFTFSEPVSGFNTSSITVKSGTLTNLASVGQAIDGSYYTAYTATFTTVAAPTEALSVSVTAGSYADSHGNSGLKGDSPALYYDSTAPTVTITSNKSALKAGETALITFTFSQVVTDFTDTDITVTGGTLGALSGSGINYTATFTPSVNYSAASTVSVTAGSYSAASKSGAAGTLKLQVDTVVPDAPTLTLGAGVADGATSSEAVQSGGVMTVVGESAATIKVTFSRAAQSVSKTLTANGSSQPVVLAAGDLTTLGDGTITVQATVTDPSGNVSTSTATNFVLDTAAPATPVLALGTNIAGGATSSEAVQSSGVVTVSAESGAKVLATFSNGSKLVTKTLQGSGSVQAITLSAADLITLTDGTINVQVVVQDMAGNASNASTTFNLMTTPPAAPVLALGSGVSTGATAGKATQDSGVVTVSSASGNVVNTTFSKGGNTVIKSVTANGSAQAVTLTSANLTALGGDGTITVSAAATDPAGNVGSSVTSSFVLDTVAPVSPVLALGTGVSDGATSSEATQESGVITVNAEYLSSVVLTFSRVGGGSVTQTISGTGSAKAVTLSAADLVTLGDGTIAVSATATDIAGNVSQVANTSFVLDTTVPTAPVLSLGSGVNSMVNAAKATQSSGVITVTAESGGAILVTFARSGGGKVTKSLTGTGSTQSVVLTAGDLSTLGDGLVVVNSSVSDASGNISLVSSTKFTLSTVAPATPVLALGSGVSDGATSSEAVQADGVVTVNAVQMAQVSVVFSRSGGGSITKTVTGTGAAQAVTLTASDLSTLGDGQIAVSATATDAADNVSKSATTGFVLDTVSPSQPSLTLASGVGTGASSAEAVSSSGVALISGESGSTLLVTFTNGLRAVTKKLVATGSTQPVVLSASDLVDLTDGTISVSVVAKDSAGNTSPAASTSFLLDTAPPSAPSFILSSAASNGASSAVATQTSGILTVSAESGSTIQVTFARSGGGSVSRTVTGTGYSQAVTLTTSDLTTLGDGTILVQATATDVVGNVSQVANTSFVLDTVAPAAPVLALGTGIANGATSSEAVQSSGVVTVSAENNSRVMVRFVRGLSSVIKLLDGSATTTAVTLDSNDLATLGDGSITVKAIVTDAAGNTSEASTTSFVLDTVAPSTPTIVLGTGVSTGATLNELTQASGVVKVSGGAGGQIQVTFSRAGGGQVVKTLVSTGSTQGVILESSDATTLGDGLISVTASVQDAAGNLSALATTSFTLDTVAPNAPQIALGAGVDAGASSAKATQASGVVTVNAGTGTTVSVTFSNTFNSITRTVIKTVTGTGSDQPVVLTTADIDSNTAGLWNGLVSVKSTAADAAGNVSAVSSSSFTLNTGTPTTPQIALGTGVANGATRSEATQASGVVTLTAQDGTQTSVTFARLNGGQVVKTLTGTNKSQAVTLTDAEVTALGDGTIRVSVISQDTSGNQSASVATNFILDTVPPDNAVLTLGTGVADTANRAEALQSSGVVTVNGESGASILATFTGVKGVVNKTLTGTGKAQAVVLVAADLATLGDGNVTVATTVKDPAGNLSGTPASTTQFTLSATLPSAPVLALGSGVSDGATSGEATQASGVVTVNGNSGLDFQVTFTNSSGVTVIKQITGTGSAQPVVLTSSDVSKLNNGSITVTTQVTDNAGNNGTSSVSFVLDTVTPIPTISSGRQDLSASGATDVVWLKFAEQVLNFDIGDLTAVGGTLSGFGQQAGTNNYFVTFTSSGASSQEVRVAGGTGSYQDLAGNVPPVQVSLTGNGRFSAGPALGGMMVTVYDEHGVVLDRSLLDEHGRYDIHTGSYVGKVLLTLTDTNGSAVNYLDEATLQGKDLGNMVLRAASVVRPGETLVANITPLTELAVREAGLSAGVTDLTGISAQDIARANAATAWIFLGAMSDITRMDARLVVDTLARPVAGANSYGQILAMLSGMDQAHHGDMEATLKQLSEMMGADGLSGNATRDPAKLVGMIAEGLDAYNAVAKQHGMAVISHQVIDEFITRETEWHALLHAIDVGREAMLTSVYQSAYGVLS